MSSCELSDGGSPGRATPLIYRPGLSDRGTLMGLTRNRHRHRSGSMPSVLPAETTSRACRAVFEVNEVEHRLVISIGLADALYLQILPKFKHRPMQSLANGRRETSPPAEQVCDGSCSPACTCPRQPTFAAGRTRRDPHSLSVDRLGLHTWARLRERALFWHTKVALRHAHRLIAILATAIQELLAGDSSRDCNSFGAGTVHIQP